VIADLGDLELEDPLKTKLKDIKSCEVIKELSSSRKFTYRIEFRLSYINIRQDESYNRSPKATRVSVKP
jgi:hypothetical protein